jgi:hypothetical protein
VIPGRIFLPPFGIASTFTPQGENSMVTRSRSNSKSSPSRARSSRKKASSRKYGKKAGEEIRTEMHHMRSGKHPVKDRKQAIAIGLSKARKEGAKVPPRSSIRRKAA